MRSTEVQVGEDQAISTGPRLERDASTFDLEGNTFPDAVFRHSHGTVDHDEQSCVVLRSLDHPRNPKDRTGHRGRNPNGKVPERLVHDPREHRKHGRADPTDEAVKHQVGPRPTTGPRDAVHGVVGHESTSSTKPLSM